MNKEKIAKVCHEVNRAYCEALGDTSQTSWEDAPQWQIDSAISGVEFVSDNADAPASWSHDNWLAEKKLAGWKYGPEKNAELKEHPCFVPYEELPVEQQAKDYIFKAVVTQLKDL